MILDHQTTASCQGAMSKSQRDFMQLFPRLSRLVGLEQTKRWVQLYEQFLAEQKLVREWESFENFRRFPLFLRYEFQKSEKAQAQEITKKVTRKMTQKVTSVDLAQLEWAEFSALYGPGDEARLVKNLGPNEVAIHPTVHMFRFASDLEKYFVPRRIQLETESEQRELQRNDSERGPVQAEKLLFVYRLGPPFHLHHVIGLWWMAVILDPLLDQGRMTLERLGQEIAVHQGSLYKEAWSDAITKVIEAGLILRGSANLPLGPVTK